VAINPIHSMIGCVQPINVTLDSTSHTIQADPYRLIAIIDPWGFQVGDFPVKRHASASKFGSSNLKALDTTAGTAL
jgi:hypothetical protein